MGVERASRCYKGTTETTETLGIPGLIPAPAGRSVEKEAGRPHWVSTYPFDPLVYPLFRIKYSGGIKSWLSCLSFPPLPPTLKLLHHLPPPYLFTHSPKGSPVQTHSSSCLSRIFSVWTSNHEFAAGELTNSLPCLLTLPVCSSSWYVRRLRCKPRRPSRRLRPHSLCASQVWFSYLTYLPAST